MDQDQVLLPGAEASVSATSDKENNQSSTNISYADGQVPPVQARAGQDSTPVSGACLEAPENLYPMPTPFSRPVVLPSEILARLGMLRLRTDPFPEVPDFVGTGAQPAASTAHQHNGPSTRTKQSSPSCNTELVLTGATVGPTAAHGEDAENCTVCWSAAACVIFQPCGHVCCCETCAKPLVAAGISCPMCRGHVTASITT